MEAQELYRKVQRWIANRENKSLECVILYAMLEYIEEHEDGDMVDYNQTRKRDSFTRDMFE